MSIVDDRMHVGSDQACRERLWQTADAIADPIALPPTSTLRSPKGSTSPNPGAAPMPDVLAHATGDQLWQARIDLVVSSGLSGDAARKSRQDAVASRSQESFDTVRTFCQDELRPVLESCVEMLAAWGLSARVTETLRDEPARVPRGFDLTLWIDRFGDRGPGKLTITLNEGSDFVRVKTAVGPTKIGGDISEHIGTTIAADLSDALVGGLVATLVEQIFTS
jgi:hypothetical protein